MSGYKHYLSAMTLQIVALLVWWPKQTLADTLAEQSTPSTLLAVLLSMAVTASFTVMREAGGELDLEAARAEGSPNLTMTAPATWSMTIVWSLFGRAAAWLFLSLPLVVAGASVSAASVWDIAANLLVLLVLLVAMGLVARCSWTWLWHRETLHYLTIRFTWLVCLAAPALLAPDASYVIQSYLQFSDRGIQAATAAASGAASLTVHGGIVSALVWQGLVALVFCALVYARPGTRPSESG